MSSPFCHVQGTSLSWSELCGVLSEDGLSCSYKGWALSATILSWDVLFKNVVLIAKNISRTLLNHQQQPDAKIESDRHVVYVVYARFWPLNPNVVAESKTHHTRQCFSFIIHYIFFNFIITFMNLSKLFPVYNWQEFLILDWKWQFLESILNVQARL